MGSAVEKTRGEVSTSQAFALLSEHRRSVRRALLFPFAGEHCQRLAARREWLQHTAAMSRRRTPSAAYISPKDMLEQWAFRKRYEDVLEKARRGLVAIPNFGPVRANRAYDKLSCVQNGATEIDQVRRTDDGSSFKIEDDVEAGTDTWACLGQWEAAVQKEGKMLEGRPLILEHSTHAVLAAYREGIIPSYNCGSQSLIYVRGWDHMPADHEPDTIYGPMAGCVELADVIREGRYCRCVSLGLARGVEKNRESFIKKLAYHHREHETFSRSRRPSADLCSGQIAPLPAPESLRVDDGRRLLRRGH